MKPRICRLTHRELSTLLNLVRDQLAVLEARASRKPGKLTHREHVDIGHLMVIETHILHAIKHGGEK